MSDRTIGDTLRWNYDAESVPEGGARKLVTLEHAGMVWVGIRAWHHMNKRWLNNGAPSQERVVAWADLPTPADPRCFALPKEIVEEHRRIMVEEVIPKIEKDIQENARRAAETRNKVIFR